MSQSMEQMLVLAGFVLVVMMFFLVIALYAMRVTTGTMAESIRAGLRQIQVQQGHVIQLIEKTQCRSGEQAYDMARLHAGERNAESIRDARIQEQEIYAQTGYSPEESVPAHEATPNI